jgi:prepilin-type N-terminal cleavage/methylation domain-containing protein
MRITSQVTTKRRGSRPGFTLLELIIVIAIIAVLTALATGVAMRFFGIQQQRNTEVTITKAYETLKRQWDQVISDANGERLPPTDPMLNAIYTTQFKMAPLNPTGDDLVARVLWIKARLRQQFPMDYSEIIAATPPSQLYFTPPQSTPPGWLPLPLGSLPALPSYYKALNNAAMTAGLPNVTNLLTLTGTPPAPTPTDAENASCLLMAISEARNGIAFNSDNVGTGAVGDTDNNGLLEIVDGWKRPLRFYRWPTGNIEIDALNPAQPGNRSYAFRDPQDRDGLLLGYGWWNGTHTAAMNGSYPFETLFHPVFTIWQYAPGDPRNPANMPANSNYTVLGPYPATSSPFGSLLAPVQYNPYYVIPYSYYSLPVIASAGPNKAFGLSQPGGAIPNPMVSEGTGDDSDNIYSYRVRLGAAGN